MPAIEIIHPSIRPTEEAKLQLHTALIPLIHSYLKSTAGFQHLFVGTSSNVQPIICIGTTPHSSFSPPLPSRERRGQAQQEKWQSTQDFEAFLTGPFFADFQAQAKPYLAAPPRIQIFESDVPVSQILGRTKDDAAVAELFVFTPDQEQDWKSLVHGLGQHDGSSTAGRVLSGRGTAKTDGREIGLGLLKWEGFEAREKILDNPTVNDTHSKLLAVQGIEHDMVEFVKF
ncbi:hypothetical protein PVAG01_10044 [Phlyctema vagabunda]|uniref:Uncharacterized protein n=1 Tax=Phlyctema vagabunda TaxID=108571 RepID=A0ABR4P4W7_9HELO